MADVVGLLPKSGCLTALRHPLTTPHSRDLNAGSKILNLPPPPSPPVSILRGNHRANIAGSSVLPFCSPTEDFSPESTKYNWCNQSKIAFPTPHFLPPTSPLSPHSSPLLPIFLISSPMPPISLACQGKSKLQWWYQDIHNSHRFIQPAREVGRLRYV